MKKMDLAKFELADLLLAAVKSEQDSHGIYARLAGLVTNAFLQERLNFLAQEERRHQQAVENIFRQRFPGRDIVVPDRQVVPLPEIHFKDEDLPLSRIIAQAMKAEQAAHDFYLQLAERFNDDVEKKNLLLYFSMMEMGHYKLLDLEKGSLERLEEFSQEQELIHLGP
ncbi:MAG TPA: ferritin family protein [Candidatus Binatia bacterium]|nr:ferritin family protein [Candidatus Binatia bacterium]